MKRGLICLLVVAGCGWDEILPDPHSDPIPPDAPRKVLDAPGDYYCGTPHDTWPCEAWEKDQICHWGEGPNDDAAIPIFTCVCDGHTWHCEEDRVLDAGV